jgi:hypothetical protein
MAEVGIFITVPIAMLVIPEEMPDNMNYLFFNA